MLPPTRSAATIQQQLTAKVKKALRYPTIILALAVLVVLAMVTLVLPEFAAIYKTFNTPLPLLTQMVMGLSAFIQTYAIALSVLLLIPVAIAWALRQDPRWQRILMHIPVTGRLARGGKNWGRSLPYCHSRSRRASPFTGITERGRNC